MQLTRPGGSRGTGSPGRRPARGAVSVWAQFRAHSSTYGPVHRWSPGSCSRGSRTVVDAGERHATLLESVLVPEHHPQSTWMCAAIKPPAPDRPPIMVCGNWFPLVGGVRSNPLRSRCCCSLPAMEAPPEKLVQRATGPALVSGFLSCQGRCHLVTADEDINQPRPAA